MEETKKKTNTAKKQVKKTKTNQKIAVKAKTKNTKKINSNKVNQKPATKNNKVEPKKTTKKVTKKTTKKAPTVKKQTKKVTPKKEDLEHTIIFDGTQNKNLQEVVNKLEEEHVVLEDKVIKRSKGKKITIIILILMIIAVIFGTVYYVYDTKRVEKINKQTLNSNIYDKVNKYYEEVVDSEDREDAPKKESNDIEFSNIETLSLKEFENKALKKENMTILVSSTSCLNSIRYEPYVNEAFKKADKIIYRINVSDFNEEELLRFRSYYAYKGTPTLFRLENGIVVKDYYGVPLLDEGLKAWVDLTK